MSEYTCRKIMDSSQVIQLFGFWGFHFSKLLNFNYMRLNIFLCDYHIYFYCIFGGAQQDIGFIPNDTDCFGRLLPSDPIIGLKLLRPKYKTIIWNIPGGWKERLNTPFFWGYPTFYDPSSNRFKLCALCLFFSPTFS